jgi:predicted transcriptional regulator
VNDPYAVRSDVVDVLSKRRDLLAAVVEEPRDKRDLVDEQGIPRSTLDRAIRGLEAAGLVERADGVYRATLFGRTALETHDRYLRTVSDLAAVADVVDPLPADSPVGRPFLEGSRSALSRPHAPDGVVEHLFDSVREATHVRGVAPVALTGHTGPFREASIGEEGRLDLVLSSDVFDLLIETEGEQMVADMEAGDANFYRGSIPFGFGLWLADDEAGIVVYTGTGVNGVVTNDAPAAVEWARDLYEGVRRDATPVGVDEVRRRLPATE